MTIHDMNDLVKSIDLQDAGVSVLVDLKEEAIQLNKDQLLSGLDNEGVKMLPRYASIQYAKKKNRMNPDAGMLVPDLYLTGALFDAFALAIQSKKEYKIFSNDSKYAALVKKYPTAFGLNEESIDNLRVNGFTEGIVNKIKEHLTL